MVSKLQLYKRPVTTVYTKMDCANYLRKQFSRKSEYGVSATDVDCEKLVSILL